MNEIFLWVAGAWMIAIGLVFALLAMSSKQDRAARDEEMAVAVRLLRGVGDDSAFCRWEERILQAASAEGQNSSRQWNAAESAGIAPSSNRATFAPPDDRRLAA